MLSWHSGSHLVSLHGGPIHGMRKRAREWSEHVGSVVVHCSLVHFHRRILALTFGLSFRAGGARSLSRFGRLLALGRRWMTNGSKASLNITFDQIPIVLVQDLMNVVDVLSVEIFLNFSLHGRIPVVLDSVICSSGKLLRYLCPSISQLTVTRDDGPVLFF